MNGLPKPQISLKSCYYLGTTLRGKIYEEKKKRLPASAINWFLNESIGGDRNAKRFCTSSIKPWCEHRRKSHRGSFVTRCVYIWYAIWYVNEALWKIVQKVSEGIKIEIAPRKRALKVALVKMIWESGLIGSLLSQLFSLLSPERDR